MKKNSKKTMVQKRKLTVRKTNEKKRQKEKLRRRKLTDFGMKSEN